MPSHPKSGSGHSKPAPLHSRYAVHIGTKTLDAFHDVSSSSNLACAIGRLPRGSNLGDLWVALRPQPHDAGRRLLWMSVLYELVANKWFLTILAPLTISKSGTQVGFPPVRRHCFARR